MVGIVTSHAGGPITLTDIGATLGNWASLGALLAVMAIAYNYRMHVEETALLTSLGAPYQSYRLRTKRIIPFIF